jgi:hypothetical protein
MEEIFEAIFNVLKSTEFWAGLITAFVFWFSKTLYNKYQDSKKPNSVDVQLWSEFQEINQAMAELRNKEAGIELPENLWRSISQFVDGDLCGDSRQKSFISRKLNKKKEHFCDKIETFAMTFAQHCQHSHGRYKVVGTNGVDNNIIQEINSLQKNAISKYEEFYELARAQLENQKKL